MLKIILVRHGETDWNKIRRIQGGGSNTLLNERGRQQVEWLAERLYREKLLAVYSSPLTRAMVTAGTIAGKHGLEVSIDESLKEIAAGELEGRTVAEVGRHFSHILLDRLDNGKLPRIPGGESLEEAQRRGWQCVQGIVNGHGEGTIAVVTHYFISIGVILAAMELPLSDINKFRLGTGSLSALDFDGEGIRLSAFNETSDRMVVG